MLLVHKLKGLEKQIMFLRWATGESFGKLNYVGEDYIEFAVINHITHEYGETLLLRPALIMEIVLGGNEVSKIIAELSNNL